MKALNGPLSKITAGLVLFMLAGCSAGTAKPEEKKADAANQPAAVNTQPVTLKFYQYSAKLTDEEFQELFVKPVKKKYPHITLELVREGKGATPQELVTAGGLPDLIFTGPAGAVTLLELDAAADMSDLIKKNSLNLSRYNKTAVDFIKSYKTNGQMFALPHSINFSALYYNKDIFDKFGVAYPKDGLTWEDAIELTKKLTRQADAVSYRGLDIDGGVQRFSEQLSLIYVDANNRAALQTDKWKQAVDTFLRIKQVPGNAVGSAAVPAFENDRTLAMLAGLGARLGELEELQTKGTPMNWDMTTMPSFREAPNKAFGISSFQLMISSTSKNKDSSFQVIQTLLEEESQSLTNKRGRLTTLEDDKVKQNFGDDLVTFNGKNKAAILKSSPSSIQPSTRFEVITRQELNKIVNQAVADNTDVNTVLRQAEEQANKLLATEKLK
jgi:multiple sugar transport system substrate-binding protein